VIPLGYMYKRVVARPDWIHAPNVDDVFSVSDCVSKDFADFLQHGGYNGFWFFDSPQIMERLAAELHVDLEQMMLFYYEAYEREFDQETGKWRAFGPNDVAPVNVTTADRAHIEGYDVTTFWSGTMAECSPLACNGLAANIPVNRHCLFDSMDDARAALERGKFADSEPGPFRIIAVHTIDALTAAR
jgi:hypothetical protein